MSHIQDPTAVPCWGSKFESVPNLNGQSLLPRFMGRNTEPLVSTVIPTYNRPDLLQGAVESVLDQTHPNIEVLVVDDHSPIPAETVLSSLSTTDHQSIQVIRHNENKGANVARNTGIKNTNGDFIAFLDDDDRWEPTKIERQVAAFQKADSTIGVVYTGQRFINDDGDITSVHISNVRGDVTEQLLSGAQIAPFSSVMVRSGVIQQAGLPDERFPCWQDREWYVRLSQYYEFESIPEPLVIRRIGKHDQIGDNYKQKRDIAYPLFLEKHRSLASEYGRVHKRKMEASLMRKLGQHALRQGRYSESRKQLMRSAVHYPFIWETYLYFLIAISGRIGHDIATKCKRGYEKHRFQRKTSD